MRIGTGFGWAIVKALEGEGLTTFVIPFGQLAVITLIAAAAGVAAAVLPARRAARLDVLGAITSEWSVSADRPEPRSETTTVSDTGSARQRRVSSLTAARRTVQA